MFWDNGSDIPALAIGSRLVAAAAVAAAVVLAAAAAAAADE